ncbi:acyltransferase [Pseudoruegeria sp. HB172150]|uniref:acyltransferase family protein n=1 Tax=Pseudoruegeria sp. HB172150 TaxID=2721164 RepID=UPI0015578AB1|nr:acyltransferase [Pseudoruegeria sp. HB172150]
MSGATPKPQLPALQILRFLAAFTVVLFHVGSGLALEYPGIPNPFAFGYFGVDVFFVLSGFIMAYATNPDHGSLHFAVRRIARIVPLYWFLTLALVVVAMALPQLLNSTEVSAESLAKSLLFIPYEKPSGAMQPILFLGWTLCYEMFFYAIYCVALNAGRMTIPVVSATLLGVVVYGWIWPPDTPLGQFYTAPILIEFILGMGLYSVYIRMRPVPTIFLSAAFAFAAASLYFLLAGHSRFIAVGLPAAAIVAAFLCLPYSSGRVTGQLVLLGNASYSLYLSHPYIIQLPIKVLSDRFSLPVTAVAASMAAVVAILVSVALFFLIEKPAQRAILRRFSWVSDTGGHPARPAQGAGNPP